MAIFPSGGSGQKSFPCSFRLLADLNSCGYRTQVLVSEETRASAESFPSFLIPWLMNLFFSFESRNGGPRPSDPLNLSWLFFSLISLNNPFLLLRTNMIMLSLPGKSPCFNVSDLNSIWKISLAIQCNIGTGSRNWILSLGCQFSAYHIPFQR